MICIENLSYQYPGASKPALQQVNLTIEKGALLGLLGPNGAGKTTLISLLTGVLKHQQGSISIAGFDIVKDLAKAKQQMACIPQDYAFYPNLTALENLDFFAGIQKIPADQKAERIRYCLEFCQLTHVAKQRASEFSGGLKRRLNIAIGLLTDPDILFFDEPTVSIDPQSRAFILEQIAKLHQQGKTIIYTSHYMEEVEQLCDHLAIIDHGQLLRQGSLQSMQEAERKKLVVELEQLPTELELNKMTERFTVEIDAKQLSFSEVADMQAYQQVMDYLQAMNLDIASVFYGKNNLETVFLDLTSKQLRD